MKKKSHLVVNLEYFAALPLIWLISALPLKACYYVSGILARLFYALDFKHRRRVIQHLMHAGVAKTAGEARSLARKNFIHLGKLAVEIIKTHQIVKPENIREHFRMSCPQSTIDTFFTPGKSKQAIVVTAHFGNWELAGMGYTVLSGLPMLSIIRPLDNPRLGEHINAGRKGCNHELCPKEGALKALLGAIKDGKCVCLVSDQHASTTEGVETVFFGHPARTHASAAMLHLRTGLPIIVGVCRRIDDEFHFEYIQGDIISYAPTGDKEGDLRKVAQLYTTALEKIIAQYPEQWMWAHRRWLDINR